MNSRSIKISFVLSLLLLFLMAKGQGGPEFKIFQRALPANYVHPHDLFPYDFDGDGNMDLIVFELEDPHLSAHPGRRPHLLKGHGDCTFSDMGDKIFKEIEFTHPRHIAVGDLNGDNIPDLFIAAHGADMSPFPGEMPGLLFNLEHRQLVDMSRDKRVITLKPGFYFNVSLGDLNGDGHNDIFLSQLQSLHSLGGQSLWLNDSKGKGHFTFSNDWAPKAVIESSQLYMSNNLLDVDGDGDLDIVLGGADGRENSHGLPHDALLINNGHGHFQIQNEEALTLFSQDWSWGTAHISSADFNHDGFPDLLLSTHNFGFSKGQLHLLINQKNGTFKDESLLLPPIKIQGNFWVSQTLVADFDRDGNQDILVELRGPGVKQNVLLYTGKSNGKFVSMTEMISMKNPQIISTAVVDCNRDLRPDIVFLSYDSHYSVAVNTTSVVSTWLKQFTNSLL